MRYKILKNKIIPFTLIKIKCSFTIKCSQYKSDLKLNHKKAVDIDILYILKCIFFFSLIRSMLISDSLKHWILMHLANIGRYPMNIICIFIVFLNNWLILYDHNIWYGHSVYYIFKLMNSIGFWFPPFL